MKKERMLLIIGCILLFISGTLLGVFYFSSESRASSPEGEVSGGEQPASVYYDEHWQAIGAYVSTEAGYTFLNPSIDKESPVVGKITYIPVPTSTGVINVPHCTLQPDMVVTKWKVHGHIHFE
jgi:hypothetical protein